VTFFRFFENGACFLEIGGGIASREMDPNREIGIARCEKTFGLGREKMGFLKKPSEHKWTNLDMGVRKWHNGLGLFGRISSSP